MNAPRSRRKLAGTVRHRLMLAVEEFKHSERVHLQKALSFVEELYEGRYRNATRIFDRGVPFIVHPMRVAIILIEEFEIRDIGAITAALLHDVVEFNREKVTIADIEKLFGRPTAMLVSILTKPPLPEDLDSEERNTRLGIYYKRLEQASAMSKLVKLADRLDSLRESPDWVELEAQKRYLDETRTFFLPMAEEMDAYVQDELNCGIQELAQAIKAVEA